MSELRTLPSNRAVRLRNERCPYCGVALTKANTTKEHIIARNLVPRGKLDAQWNLILNACATCNVRKSALEDSVAAITMQPDALGRNAVADAALPAEARRKGKAFSPRTRRAVAHSKEHWNATVRLMANATATMGFTAPPQIALGRVYQLAAFQVAGFFYWFSNGRFCPGEFRPVMASIRSDWGNAVQRTFMEQVVSWHGRVVGRAAGGFFKVAIRRHARLLCWSWALEWNHNLRVVGYMGEPAAINECASALPALRTHTLGQFPLGTLTFREDVPLADNDDKLFV